MDALNPPRIRLVVLEGRAEPKSFEPGGATEIRLGRDPGCQIRIAGERVSRQHARIFMEGDRWVLEDLGSSAGTLVAGSRVTRYVLDPGDEFQLGPARLRLEAAAATATLPVPLEAGVQGQLLATLAALLADDPRPASDLLPAMLGGLLEGFGADRAFIFLPGPGEAQTRAAGKVRPGADLGEDEAVSKQLVARVAAERTALLLSSAETLELRKELASIAGTLRSILAAPLDLGATTGVLYLDSAMERRRFGPTDRDLLLAFATAAGRVVARDQERRQAAVRGERMAELLKRAVGGELLGRSPAFQAVLDEVAKAAAADVTVLLGGESGTGKELVARALHRAGKRCDQAFVAVNCAAIPPELLESELFGHEKGAFSGAAERRLGHFELADGGTLFLDEVGELPAAAQGKLLRTLQERTVTRVGGSKPVPVDFRLVAATHVDLADAISHGRFREDLFYRLAVFRIRLPPLRERGDDILLLARDFLARFARELGRPVPILAPEACRLLVAHPWPGNVRELRNVIEQALVREDGNSLGPATIAPALGPARGLRSPSAPAASSSSPGLSFAEATEAFERELIIAAVARRSGNMKAASEDLKMARRVLYKKCDALGIDYSGFRDE